MTVYVIAISRKEADKALKKGNVATNRRMAEDIARHARKLLPYKRYQVWTVQVVD